MRINVEHIGKHVIDFLQKESIKYELHTLNSDVVMIDVWNNHNFYVIQIEEDSIGISKIDNENPGFDTKPDKLFYSSDEFLKKLGSELV